MAAAQWKIVGGGDKGGLLARKAKKMDSTAYEDRLATGSVVEEVALQGERLSYKLLTGTGPKAGWISIKVKGKAMAIRIETTEELVQQKPEKEAEQKSKEDEKMTAEEAERQRVAEELRKKEEEDAKQKAAEEEATRKAEEAARKAAEEAEQKAKEEERLKAEEAERQRAAEELRKKEEEDAKQKAAEEEAKRKAEEAARIAAEEAEQKAKEEERLKAEEAERLRVAEELRKKEEEDAKQKAAEEEAARKAEEAARKAAEEAEQKAKEEERLKAEEAERQRVAEELRKKEEEDAKQKAAEEEIRRKADEEARQKAEEEAKQMSEAEEHKTRGNGLLKDGKYSEAVDAYTKAIEVKPETAAFWSNRSHANLKAGQCDAALSDAEKAVSLQPTWAKGHHRKAKALQEMGRFLEAAAACSEGAKAAAGSSEASEVKLLERLQAEMMQEAAMPALLGWWHGKVSAALGGFDQEFNFLAGGKMQCVVYGQELDGTYAMVSVEKSKGGGFTGGLDVSLNDTKVPYLFKVGESDSMLHLCCPMNSPDLRPRTFDGPGYLGMQSGRLAGGDAATLSAMKELSESQRIVRYLDELTEIMEANPAMQQNGGGDGAEAAELLEEAGPGTLSASQLGKKETLEDKQKKLQAEQTLSALRLKYTPEIEEQAQKLIKKEVKAASLYSPEEVRELEKRLRRFKPKEEPQSAAAEQPQNGNTAAQKPAASDKPELPKKMSLFEAELKGIDVEATPTSAQEKMNGSLFEQEAQEEVKPEKKAPQRSSCWQGCFAGLRK